MLRHSPQLVRKVSSDGKGADELFLRVTPEMKREREAKLGQYDDQEEVVSVHSSMDILPRSKKEPERVKDTKLEQITSLSQLQRIKGVTEVDGPVSPKLQVIIKRNSPHLRVEDRSDSGR